MGDDNSEHITALPKELLRRILSLVPLKEAVRTTVLSSSWQSLWAPNSVEFKSNSDLPTIEHAHEKFQHPLTTLLLKPCLSPELWQLHLSPPENDHHLALTAAKGIAGELYLIFSGKNPAPADLQLVPGSVHRSPNPPPAQPPVNLVSGPDLRISTLRSLHLRSVSQVGEGLVSSLFSSCPLLESLSMEKCEGLRSVSIEAGESLEKLEILDCPNMASVKVSAANLSRFWYRGGLPKIEINGCPCLADVVLDLREGLGQYEFECEELVCLLASLKDVEILMISGWLLEWVCTAGVIFSRLRFQFNKLKSLHWLDALLDRTKRNSLACFLNATPSLENLLVEIDQDLTSITCPPSFMQYWHEPHLCVDFATVKSNASPLEHLKRAKLKGFSGKDDQLLLMDLLLKQAGVVLKSMTVTTSPEKESWSISKIPISQRKHVFGTPSKHIAIPSPNEDYYFGLIDRNYHLCK
ncbi:hypothetical protein NMG60_11005427 [Bertholletia excelsa]